MAKIDYVFINGIMLKREQENKESIKRAIDTEKTQKRIGFPLNSGKCSTLGKGKKTGHINKIILPYQEDEKIVLQKI